MPDALSLGPLAIPSTVLVALVALGAAYVALIVYRKKLPHQEAGVGRLVDRGANALLLAFLVWKLFPLVNWWSEILADPVLLLRLPGGRGGVIVGSLVGIVWLVPLLKREPALFRPLVIGVAASGVGALVALGGLQSGSAPTAYDRGELFRTEVTILEGDAAPEPLLDGDRPAVLTFWATWCGPCHAELPVKKAAFRETDGGVRFLAINMTNTESGVDAVERYVTDNAIPYPVGLDQQGRLATLLAVRGTPTTVVLDADGTVIARWMGPSDLGRIIRAVDDATNR